MSTNRTEANGASPRTPDERQPGGCEGCSRPDTFDNFVQCDQCDSWWHMICAGVTESIAGRAWTCRYCVPRSVTSRSSGKSARIALRLQMLEEERAIQQRTLEAEKRAIEEERKLMQEKYNLLEEQLEEQRENASIRSRVSHRANLHRVSNWVDDHSTEGAVSGDPAGETSTVAPVEGTRTVTTATTDGPSVVGKSSTTELGTRASNMEQHSTQQSQETNRAPEQPRSGGNQQQYTGAIPKTGPKKSERIADGRVKPMEGNRVPSEPPVIPPGKPQFSFPTIKNVAQPSTNYYQHMLADILSKLGPISPPDSEGLAKLLGAIPITHGYNAPTAPLPSLLERNDNEVAPTSGYLPNVNPLQPRVPLTIPEQNVPPTPSTITQSNLPHPIPAPSVLPISLVPNPNYCVPSPSQLAARQIMPRDLPPFAGNPADWPIFISAFVNTTAACGYSSVENLSTVPEGCSLRRRSKPSSTSGISATGDQHPSTSIWTSGAADQRAIG